MLSIRHAGEIEARRWSMSPAAKGPATGRDDGPGVALDYRAGVTPHGERPRLTILIVSWNTRSMLLDCLSSLHTSTSMLHETIVVDNGSSDGSAEAVTATFPGVTLIRNPTNMGFAHASAQGYERARGDYILLLNSDTLVGRGALERSVEFADEHPRAGAVGMRLTHPDGSFQPSCFRFPSLWGLCLASAGLPRLLPSHTLTNWDGYGGRDWSRPQEVDFAMGSFLLVRASAAREVGWLDTRFFLYGEEADLCLRLQQRGWSTLYCPDVSVVHHQGGSSRESRVAAWAYEAKQRAILFFLHKHRGTPRAWLGNLVMLAGMPARLVLWSGEDLLDALRTGSRPTWSRLAKARILRFHLAALLRPDRVCQSWSPRAWR